ncbi:hypothetical protein HK100_000351 [Physocladia obscura]|uniref:Peptidase M14 domain-containing protein n=1 Tax=Physocladia obscura TaxID=109957 RepID=A0AAD5T4J6_9FUNG|nr:hypothetical protein HK100_000351 [Physocladia obscura]
MKLLVARLLVGLLVATATATTAPPTGGSGSGGETRSANKHNTKHGFTHGQDVLILDSPSHDFVGDTQPYRFHKIVRIPCAEPFCSKESFQSLLQNSMAVVSVLSWTSKHVDVQINTVVDPASVLPFLSGVSVLVDDVQDLVDREMNRLALSQAAFASLDMESLFAPDVWFSDYHKYDQIVAWFKDLSDKFPDLITFIPSIGKTYLKKDIIGIKVGSSVNADTKPQFWFHSGDHAREWIGPATVQFLVHNLVTEYASNPTLLDSTELIIVPLMNVDGYEHTWSGNRLWRKNRRPIKKDFFGSVGVDLNRNWPAHWGEGGSSSYPFSDTYMGPSAGSEPEVQSLISFFKNDNHTRLIGAIDFHSFSQLILRPYGWTEERAPDEKHLKTAGDGIRDAIKRVSGKKYVSEREIDLYAASGTASDWFYDEEVQEWLPDRRLYAYTIELRPSADEANGANGFILPPDQIVPTGQEILAAVKYYLDYARKNPLKV